MFSEEEMERNKRIISKICPFVPFQHHFLVFEAQLELEACTELKCARPARAENLTNAAARPPEAARSQSAIVTIKVGNVKQIEDLSDQREVVLLGEADESCQTQIL